jgi:hypothetical protein
MAVGCETSCIAEFDKITLKDYFTTGKQVK